MSQGSKGTSKLMVAVWLIVMVFIVTMYVTNSSDEKDNDHGSATDKATLERIQPVGKVSIEKAVTSIDFAQRSAEDLYPRCQGCHDSGLMGAPKFGSLVAWAPIIERGIDNVIQVAISGVGSMPARGGCSDCSDAELKSIIQYMMDNAK